MAIPVDIPAHLKKPQAIDKKLVPGLKKGWGTPYGFVDFTKPVSYEYACNFMKEQQEHFAKLFAKD